MKNRPKVQHYVTASYLHKFTTGAGRKAMLYVYERNKSNPFRQKPEQAARATNCYSVKREDGTWDDSIENLLGDVESTAVPLIERLSAHDFSPSWNDRVSIAIFIAFQEFRVPWARAQMETLYRGLIDKTLKFTTRVPGGIERDLETMKKRGVATEDIHPQVIREIIEKGKYKINISPGVSLKMMLEQVETVSRFYSQMMWKVLRSTADRPFVTSDNPVVKFVPTNDGFRGVGLVNPNIEIRFPLTKTGCLVISHDHDRVHRIGELRQAGKTSEADSLRDLLPKLTFVTVDKQTVEHINLMAISYAAKHVYSPMRLNYISHWLTGEPEGLRIVV